MVFRALPIRGCTAMLSEGMRRAKILFDQLIVLGAIWSRYVPGRVSTSSTRMH